MFDDGQAIRDIHPIYDLSQSLCRTGPTCQAIPASFAEGSTPRRCGVPLPQRSPVLWRVNGTRAVLRLIGLVTYVRAPATERSWALISRGLSADTTHSSYYRNLAYGRASHCSHRAKSKIYPVREWPDCRLAANAIFTREIHGRLHQVQVMAISGSILPRRFLGEFRLVTEGDSRSLRGSRQKTTPINTIKRCIWSK